MSDISHETKRRVIALFPSEQVEDVANILSTRCGNNLPGLADLSPVQLERFQFAALKVSGGNFDGLTKAIELANIDWRDLLMTAGFGYELEAHKTWWPK